MLVQTPILRLLSGFGVTVFLLALSAECRAQCATDIPGVLFSSGEPENEQLGDRAAGGAADGQTSESRNDNGSDRPAQVSLFRQSVACFGQSATTETLGVGQDVQSDNPRYEWTFALWPRYYILPDPANSLSLRANLALFSELTDSDVTTERGEWSLTDARVYLRYIRQLYAADEYATLGIVDLPDLRLPTSKASFRSGMYFSLGAALGLAQLLPLVREGAWLRSFGIQVQGSYRYTATEATTPTTADLQRVYTDPFGNVVPAEQLGGVAFARHQASFILAGFVQIIDGLLWDVTLGWQPSFKYRFSEVQICGNIDTGCVLPERIDDPQTFSVVTIFATSFQAQLTRLVSASLGYQNVALQLGPDGQRRNMLYSPDARFTLNLSLHLASLFDRSDKARRQAGSFVPSNAPRQVSLRAGTPPH